MNLNVDRNLEETTVMQTKNGVKSGWSLNARKVLTVSLSSNVTKSTGQILRRKVLKVKDAYRYLTMDKEIIHTMDYFLSSRTISVLKIV
jgi:hypothetical protein